MKVKLILVMVFNMFLILGCGSNRQDLISEEMSETIFPKGERINSKNFTGSFWLNMMGAKDSSMHTRYGLVTFEPKARTNWHLHPGGQLLFITKGQGYYQAKGQNARLLNKGDYVEIPPNVEHWHGAAPNSEFSHIAISLNTDRGNVIWLRSVSDEEYSKIN